MRPYCQSHTLRHPKAQMVRGHTAARGHLRTGERSGLTGYDASFRSRLGTSRVRRAVEQSVDCDQSIQDIDLPRHELQGGLEMCPGCLEPVSLELELAEVKPGKVTGRLPFRRLPEAPFSLVEGAPKMMGPAQRVHQLGIGGRWPGLWSSSSLTSSNRPILIRSSARLLQKSERGKGMTRSSGSSSRTCSNAVTARS